MESTAYSKKQNKQYTKSRPKQKKTKQIKTKNEEIRFHITNFLGTDNLYFAWAALRLLYDPEDDDSGVINTSLWCQMYRLYSIACFWYQWKEETPSHTHKDVLQTKNASSIRGLVHWANLEKNKKI